MSEYTILENEDVERKLSEENQNYSDWPHGRGVAYERPQSRQHTGTEVAFFDVCYEIPVKEKREKRLKKLLSNVRLENLLFSSPNIACFYPEVIIFGM